MGCIAHPDEKRAEVLTPPRLCTYEKRKARIAALSTKAAVTAADEAEAESVERLASLEEETDKVAAADALPGAPAERTAWW